MKKRIIAVLMAAAVLVSFTSVAVAARASRQLSTYNVTMSARGNGQVRVSAHVFGTHSNMYEIGFPTVVIYEKNGTTWSCVHLVNSEYNYNAGSHGYQYTYQGVAGRQYYAYSSFFASDSEGSDSRTATSTIITAN